MCVKRAYMRIVLPKESIGAYGGSRFMAGYKRQVSRGTIKYVAGGVSAGPRRTFQAAADLASQKDSWHGRTRLTVSDFDMNGWLWKRAGNWRSNSFSLSVPLFEEIRSCTHIYRKPEALPLLCLYPCLP
jgi:hypothetical protein